MRLLLTILFFSISYCYSQAQVNYVKGIGMNGKEGNYKATALPMTTTVQTSLRNKSDSLKIVFRAVSDLQKTIKILRDSVAWLSIPDTTKFTGNTKVRQVRKHYEEVEILK